MVKKLFCLDIRCGTRGELERGGACRRHPVRGLLHASLSGNWKLRWDPENLEHRPGEAPDAVSVFVKEQAKLNVRERLLD